MESSKSIAGIEDAIFPKLVRVRPRKLTVERHIPGSGMLLESKIDESFTVGLEEAEIETESNVPEEFPKLRVTVDITFNATWREKATKRTVVTFEGDFEGIFHFPKNTLVPGADQYIRNKLYRDVLISQVYPVARSQMISTVQMVGVNAKRDLGFDLHNTAVEIEEL